MSEFRIRRDEQSGLDVVSLVNPVPVEIVQTTVPGRMQVWDYTIQVSTTLYTAADAVGGLLQFGGAARSPLGSGAIVSASLVDLADQAAAVMSLVLFNERFTPTADNAAMAVAIGRRAIPNAQKYSGALTKIHSTGESTGLFDYWANNAIAS